MTDQIRVSLTHRCSGCGALYSWIPTPGEQPPRLCGIKGCNGHGEPVVMGGGR